MNISLSQYNKTIERLRAVLTLWNDVAIFDKKSPSRKIWTSPRQHFLLRYFTKKRRKITRKVWCSVFIISMRIFGPTGWKIVKGSIKQRDQYFVTCIVNQLHFSAHWNSRKMGRVGH